MFKELFLLKFGSSCETQILEACEWDEDRASQVMDIFSEFMTVCADEGIVRKESISKKLKSDFGEVLDEYESKAILEILEHSMKNAPLLMGTEDKYDN